MSNDRALPARWQWRSPAGDEQIMVTVRAEAINVITLRGNNSFTFDPQGRLHGAFVAGRNYRRSLDNRMLCKWRAPGQPRQRQWLGTGEARDVVELAVGVPRGLATMAGDAPPVVRMSLARAGRWDWAALQVDAQRFASLYTPVGILPPDQYLALVLQATHGCSHNACTFCDFFQDIPFRIKSPEQFRSHLAGVLDFFGPALAMRRSIFLADANALVIPMPRLLALLDVLGEGRETSEIGKTGADGEERGRDGDARVISSPISGHRSLLTDHRLPSSLPLHAFIDAFHVERKAPADWQELRGRGLQRVTIGMESGHDALLRWLNKPGNADDVLDAVTTLKSAGVAVSIIVMVGAGGARYDGSHVADTVALLNTMPLDSGDLIYLSPFQEHPGSAYAVAAAAAGVKPLPQLALQGQAAAIRGGYAPPKPDDAPRFAPYRIDEFVY